jgi:hypothetical protein
MWIYWLIGIVGILVGLAGFQWASTPYGISFWILELALSVMVLFWAVHLVWSKNSVDLSKDLIEWLEYKSEKRNFAQGMEPHRSPDFRSEAVNILHEAMEDAMEDARVEEEELEALITEAGEELEALITEAEKDEYEPPPEPKRRKFD